MQPKESSLPSDRFSSPSKKGSRGMKVELSPTATPLHRGPAMARQASSEFIAKINDDRFLLRKLPSPNVTTIYLISVVLSQARHCSVKSHPFPSLSPPPSSSDVRASMSFPSLSPCPLPFFLASFTSSYLLCTNSYLRDRWRRRRRGDFYRPGGNHTVICSCTI